jgi:O-antigen/teichoic acid export membrane protein
MVVQHVVFLMGTTAIAALCLLAMAAIRPGWRAEDLILPMTMALTVCLAHDFLRRYFYSSKRPWMSVAIDVSRHGTQVAILVAYLLARWPATSATALWIMAASSLVAVALVLPFLGGLAWSRSDFKAISIRNWRFAKWMTASAILSWATSNLYVMATGALIGAATVGGMRAAQNIVGVSHLLFQGLENVVPVAAARRLAAHGPDAVSAYLRGVAVKGGLATAFITGIFALFPEFWLVLLFGESFRPYGHLVRWWAAFEVLSFLSLPLSVWIRTFEHTRAGFVASLCTATVSIALVYPLVANFGASGAMMGMIISALTQIAVLVTIIRRMHARARPGSSSI